MTDAEPTPEPLTGDALDVIEGEFVKTEETLRLLNDSDAEPEQVGAWLNNGGFA
ncbi:MAG: hypothetical protein ACKVHU_02730 [Acidimicrobiales bacterium]